MKLITHLHLVPELIMSEVMPPLPMRLRSLAASTEMYSNVGTRRDEDLDF